jgi:hypothetical protein
MRKTINWILGGLIALLSGCKSPLPISQKAEIRVLYGPPAVFIQPTDTTPNEIER